MTDRSQPNEYSAALIDKIRRIRNLQRISARALAARMTEQGYPTSRSMIANSEGKKNAITVDFAGHAARALGMSLAQLVVDPALCPSCGGEPPVGFTCNTCGETAS